MKLAISKILADQNMSQAELCRKTGLTTGYMSLVVNGQRAPSPATLRKIAEALNVSMSELMGDRATPDGFADQVTPFNASRTKLSAMLSLLETRPAQPMAYTAREPAPGFSIAQGDIVIAEMRHPAAAGDLVIANVLQDDGSSFRTVLGRWAPPFIVPSSADGDLLKVDDSGDIAVHGVVVGVFRGVTR